MTFTTKSDRDRTNISGAKELIFPHASTESSSRVTKTVKMIVDRATLIDRTKETAK